MLFVLLGTAVFPRLTAATFNEIPVISFCRNQADRLLPPLPCAAGAIDSFHVDAEAWKTTRLCSHLHTC